MSSYLLGRLYALCRNKFFMCTLIGAHVAHHIIGPIMLK